MIRAEHGKVEFGADEPEPAWIFEAVLFAALRNPSQRLADLPGHFSAMLSELCNPKKARVIDRQAFFNVLKDIIKRLERISTDGGKLAEDFQRLGKHITNTKSAYDDSEKRLSLMVDRVKNVIEIGESSAADEIQKIETPPIV